MNSNQNTTTAKVSYEFGVLSANGTVEAFKSQAAAKRAVVAGSALVRRAKGTQVWYTVASSMTAAEWTAVFGTK